MRETPDPRDPGRDEDPPGAPAGPGDRPGLGSPGWRLVRQGPDWPEWMDQVHANEEDPGDPDEDEDQNPDNAPPAGLDDFELEALLAQAREVSAEQARAGEAAARLGYTAVLAALGAASAGRRGPGMPGSARALPGEHASPAAGPAQMPEGWGEFTGRELGAVLGLSAGDAEEILDLAWALEVTLPGARAASRAGTLSRDNAAILAWATALLDRPRPARPRPWCWTGAGSLTPAQLRAAIRRAVMQVNPDKAKKRREHAARRTRVERRAEDSGNAGPASWPASARSTPAWPGTWPRPPPATPAPPGA